MSHRYDRKFSVLVWSFDVVVTASQFFSQSILYGSPDRRLSKAGYQKALYEFGYEATIADPDFPYGWPAGGFNFLKASMYKGLLFCLIVSTEPIV